MSCNTCRKTYSLFRKERGCPNCGFSYCTSCLNNKIVLPEKGEVKVCIKCNNKLAGKDKPVAPPDVYFKRLEKIQGNPEPSNSGTTSSNAGLIDDKGKSSSGDVVLKEIEERLARLKKIDLPSESKYPLDIENKAALFKATEKKLALDVRTDAKKADDLLKQYTEEVKLDEEYQTEFDDLMKQMTDRLQALKDERKAKCAPINNSDSDTDYDDDEVKDIIKKIKEIPNVDPKLVPSYCPKCFVRTITTCSICNELCCNGCTLYHINHCLGVYVSSSEYYTSDSSSSSKSSKSNSYAERRPRRPKRRVKMSKK